MTISGAASCPGNILLEPLLVLSPFPVQTALFGISVQQPTAHDFSLRHDLLFIGGGFSHESFRAYARVRPGAVENVRSHLETPRKGGDTQIPGKNRDPGSLEESKDMLDRRISLFRVLHAPLTDVIQALDVLGVDVCCETSANVTFESYVDEDGMLVFHGNDLISSIHRRKATLREIMNGIIRLAVRYTWKRVEATQDDRVVATDKLNVVPKKPRLDFIVEGCEVSGNPIDILSQLAKNPKYAALRPLTVQSDQFPNVSLKTERGSARDFLNEMVRRHPGLTWHCLPGGLVLRYIPKPVARQVDLVYPEMRRGKPTNLSFKYELVWDKLVYGIPTVVVEKHKVPPRP